jgi:SAM-dependent methyltransferase
VSLRSRRKQLEDDFANDSRRRLLSPAIYGLERTLVPELRAHARGRFLDAGCGHQPYRPVVEPRVERYVSLDVEARVDGVDHIADLCDMSVLADAAYDTVLCSEVLEHVADTDAAVAELARVLAPGGSLILTVPFLARLHEEPHDYYRFTRHGLTTVLGRVGLEIVTIRTTGSVCSFLGHQVSTAILASTWGIPIVGRAAFSLNAALVTLPANTLDRLLPIQGIAPLGYVVVAQRRATR